MISKIATYEAVNIWGSIAWSIYCLVTLENFESEIAVTWRTNVSSHRIAWTLFNTEHFIESKCIKLILKVTPNIFPVTTLALCKNYGRFYERRASIYHYHCILIQKIHKFLSSHGNIYSIYGHSQLQFINRILAADIIRKSRGIGDI